MAYIYTAREGRTSWRRTGPPLQVGQLVGALLQLLLDARLHVLWQDDGLCRAAVAARPLPRVTGDGSYNPPRW
jgi:hypothetical protein